ncbi:MAG: cytochrome C oxidase subunit IV family protein [Acidobacteriia bacterium]|nr:cytochrome C oxidase subunit IV family protein [Terriglobia bacterium]
MSHDSETAIHPTRLFLWVWTWLLALTGIEVFLGYKQLELKLMLTILMMLSVIKAGLIMSYFMHLKFEKARVVFTLIPALVVVICLFSAFFPDSLRALHLGWGR